MSESWDWVELAAPLSPRLRRWALVATVFAVAAAAVLLGLDLAGAFSPDHVRRLPGLVA